MSPKKERVTGETSQACSKLKTQILSVNEIKCERQLNVGLRISCLQTCLPLQIVELTEYEQYVFVSLFLSLCALLITNGLMQL